MIHEHSFDYSKYWQAHGHCVLYDPVVLALDAIGNVFTATAYMLIPMLLLRTIVGMWFFITPATKGLIIHGGIFIFLCGLTHIINTVNWWKTYYGLQSWVVMSTGIVSLWFVIRLYFYILRRRWYGSPDGK